MPLFVVVLASPDAAIATGGAIASPLSFFGNSVPGTGFTLSAVPFWFLPIPLWSPLPPPKL
ncbi:hypothetical protein AWB82_07286 [Caballeronia glebae]|uniref:Uncharacterized protein n=1 Tax=Caballeronia glebae TaxID=1777143 RepID=A0A158DXN2_9BURK|nr:hypothetical protein AWB82_07286 [Caballeronia glebae]